jgi:signal transduction histidine kinase
LIDNALKYSGPATTVQLTGQIRPGEIWIGVKDEGPGIEPAEIPFLFQSFGHKKINTVPTAGEKSTGLGLAICKRVIETHSGQIGVDSTPGQGSTFWFSLPNTIQAGEE